MGDFYCDYFDFVFVGDFEYIVEVVVVMFLECIGVGVWFVGVYLCVV